MASYQEKFPVGTRVRIADTEQLLEFQRTWKYHHPLQDEQIGCAGRLEEVSKVTFYHGGDVLYQLKGMPFVWHGQCLLPATASWLSLFIRLFVYMKTPYCIMLGIVGVVLMLISNGLQTHAYEAAGVPWEHRIYESGGQHYYMPRGGALPSIPDPKTLVSPEQYAEYQWFDTAGKPFDIVGLMLVWYGFGKPMLLCFVDELKRREKVGTKERRWFPPPTKPFRSNERT